MSNNCDMIKDLLPLYADDVCSDESRKTVEEHIKECADCRTELEKLRKSCRDLELTRAVYRVERAAARNPSVCR